MIEINIKTTSGKKFKVEVEPDVNISGLKELGVEPAGIEVGRQRLIYKGHVLKDDRSLESYGIKNTDTVILVKSAPKNTRPAPAQPPAATTSDSATPASDSSAPSADSSAPSAPSGSAAADNPFAALMGGGMGGMPPMPPGMDQMLQNPQFMSGMMQSPMMQQMMQQMSQNPEMLTQMIQSNPMLSQMVNSNPQMASIMNNPQLLQTILNPQTMNAVMQMQQAMRQMNQPPAATGTSPSSADAQGQQQAPPLPDMSAMMNLFNQIQPQQQPAQPQQQPAEPQQAAQPQQPAQDPAILYREQLSQLNSMGFTDKDANIRALVQTGGNVEAAVNIILGMI